VVQDPDRAVQAAVPGKGQDKEARGVGNEHGVPSFIRLYEEGPQKAVRTKYVI
jgi:hypothetical protein